MLRIVFIILIQMLLCHLSLSQTKNTKPYKVRFGNSIYYQLKTDVPGTIQNGRIMHINDSVFVLKSAAHCLDTIRKEDFSVVWIANAKYNFFRYTITIIGLAALPLGVILIKDGVRGYGLDALMSGLFISSSALAAIVHFNKMPIGKLLSVSHSQIKYIP